MFGVLGRISCGGHAFLAQVLGAPESSPSPPSLVSFSPFLFLLLFLLRFSSCYGLFVGVPSTNSCAEAVLPRWWCLEVGFGEIIGSGQS